MGKRTYCENLKANVINAQNYLKSAQNQGTNSIRGVNEILGELRDLTNIINVEWENIERNRIS